MYTIHRSFGLSQDSPLPPGRMAAIIVLVPIGGIAEGEGAKGSNPGFVVAGDFAYNEHPLMTKLSPLFFRLRFARSLMFDPTHKWMGIPPDEQPPHHYRLLSIATFESDREVINAAADKQLAFLHPLADGEHGAAAADLANQVSAARLCLVSDTRKRAYDDRLRQLLNATLTARHADLVSDSPESAIAQPVAVRPVANRHPRSVATRRRNSFNFIHYSAIVAVVGLLGIGVALKRGLVRIDPDRAAWLGITIEPPTPSAPISSPETHLPNNADLGNRNDAENRQ